MSLVLIAICFLFQANSLSSSSSQIWGYIPVNQKMNGNLFYWIFESQGSPKTDPVVLWVSGGPGCSGGLASFYENGPYSINANLTLNDNPYSWNKVATVIYIDQPVDVGYSYADSPYVVDETGVGHDMRIFFLQFFKKFPQFSSQGFYISGESYGGKYVPTMATVILDLNKKEMKNDPINLKGISIGNGVVNPSIQFPLQPLSAFEAGVVTRDQYNSLVKDTIPCQEFLKQKMWSNASASCNQIMMNLLHFAGDINPTNYKDHCQIQNCFNYDNITNYLNQASIKSQLGVPANVSWQTCNFDIQFTDKDQMDSVANDQISHILDHSNIRVLIYYGDLDLVCPYQGGLAWMVATKWSGQKAFVSSKLTEWKKGKELYGWAKSYSKFTYVRVANGGHMAPHDAPISSLDLFSNFVKNLPFTGR